jgi:hypothetical protein
MSIEGRVIKPSSNARQLFNRMAMHGDEDSHLGIEQTLMLGVEELRRGNDPLCKKEIAELVEQEWIDSTQDGGWKLMRASLPLGI